MSFSEKIRKSVSDLRELVKLEADIVAPPAELISKLRQTADRLYYMGKHKSEDIASVMRKVLEDLDAAIQMVGGTDGEWGRRIMNLVRKLDGFEVSTNMQLRAVSEDGFTRPSSLQFVSSFPSFQEKAVETLMAGLYDMADEMEGKDED